MKHLRTLFLCVLLCLACTLTFAACDKDTAGDTDTTDSAVTTEAPSDETTDGETAPETEPTTDAETTVPAETDPNAPDNSEDTTDAANAEYDPELYVVIRTAEDLMAFNKAVNEDEEIFDGMTIIFLDDIDMTGYTWTPLNGMWLDDVTFDGMGHTVSNIEFATHAPDSTNAQEIGSGFVGVAYGSLTFRDITFDNCHVTAYERAVACIIGLNNVSGGYTEFINVQVNNFTADGWMDYTNTNRDEGGHPIAFRLAGFIGHNMAGYVNFESCKVSNIKLSGFHNLAAFIGYDGTTVVDAFCFSDCVVESAEFTFSYCLSDAYTVDMAKKFVSVFFNGTKWVDNIDDCVDLGNTFSGVSYYDWTDDNAEYTPADFRSWTAEEANGTA